MSSFKEELLSKGIKVGMDVFQKVMGNPVLKPIVTDGINNIFQIKKSIEDKKKNLMEKMQIATYDEQEHLQGKVVSLEKKLERLERRLKEMQKKAREVEREKQKVEREATKAAATTNTINIKAKAPEG